MQTPELWLPPRCGAVIAIAPGGREKERKNMDECGCVSARPIVSLTLHRIQVRHSNDNKKPNDTEDSG